MLRELIVLDLDHYMSLLLLTTSPLAKPRDITDTLLLARQEAEDDPMEANLEKLTDVHIRQTLSDIMFGK